MYYHTNKPPPFWRKCVPIFGGIIFNLVFGSTYTFGNLGIYVISYMRSLGNDHIHLDDFSGVYSIAVACLGLMMFFGAMLQERVGIKMCALLGSIIFSLSVFTSAWTITTMCGFTLTFGFLFGLADGLTYSCPISSIYQWWPTHNGLPVGLVLAGTSMSSLIFGPLQSWLINPNNLSPTHQPYSDRPNELYFDDPNIIQRVPTLFITLGCIYAVLSITGSFLLSPPKYNKLDERLPFAHYTPNHPNQQVLHTLFQEDLSPSKIIVTKQFWIIWLTFMIHGQYIIYLTLFWKIIGLNELGISDFQLSYWGNVCIATSNSMGRIIWGILGDHLSIRSQLALISVSVIALLSCFNFLFYFDKIYFFVWISLLNFCFGGTFVVIPTAVKKLFGERHFAANYGITFTARIASAFISQTFISHFYSILSTHKIIQYLALLTILSLFFITFCKEYKPHQMKYL